MKALQQLYRNQLWYAGRLLLIPLCVVALAGWWIKPLFVLSVASFLFLFYFFRVPSRPVSDDSSVLVSPADGTIVAIEAMRRNDRDYTRISIFLSPLDVHVNWIPMSCRIVDMVYTPGKFFVAWAEKSSEINERLELALQTKNGEIIYLRQIAGFIARRIWCTATIGQEMRRGELYGMIRFGSRVDIIIPAESSILVDVGMRVAGSKTLIGRLPKR